jgi:uncharacterized protein (TIGR00661 family)
MHILYGVQGTGNGHISRASAMMQAFQAYPDLKLTWLLSGRERARGCGAIEQFEWREGITFVTGNGRVQLLPTLMKNNLLRFAGDVRNLDLKPYDLVISDYEPVISHAARRRGVPVTGIGHQYAFEHAIPMAGTNPVVNTLMRIFAPVQLGIGLHWHHFDAPILPPIIDLELPASLPPVQPDKVIVYLPFENLQAIRSVLQQFRGFEFTIYHPEAIQEDAGNLHLRPISRRFKQDLLDAAMVMTNSGFELISECLQLGKRILTKPLQGQMEQLSNAAALRELGYAHVIGSLDAREIGAWLQDSKAAVQVVYPDVAAELARWIATGQKESREELAQQLWLRTAA